MEKSTRKGRIVRRVIRVMYLIVRSIFSTSLVPLRAYYQLAMKSSRYKRKKHQLPGIGMELFLITGIILMGIGELTLTILGI